MIDVTLFYVITQAIGMFGVLYLIYRLFELGKATDHRVAKLQAWARNTHKYLEALEKDARSKEETDD